jgi:hypothetical protein
MFGVGDGFDICIGNPPYIRGTKFKELNSYFKKHFLSAQYQVDLYVLFIELGINLLNSKGILSYITPNSWLKNTMMSELRKIMLKKLTFLVVAPSLFDVFSAKVDTAIFIAQSDSKNADKKLKIVELKDGNTNVLREIEQSRFYKNENFIFDVEADEKISVILKKIRGRGYTLESEFNITRGINPYDKYRGQSEEVIKTHAYHANFKKDKTFVPEIRGKHVNRYCYEWDGKHFISYGDWLAAPRDQAFFTGERIVMREILSDRFVCTLITEDIKIDRSLYIAKPIENNNCRYVLGVLASHLMAWFFRHEKNEFDDIFPKIRLGEFKTLPIPTAGEGDRAAIEKLVSYVLYLTEQLKNIPSHGKELMASADDKLMLSYFEQIIDAAVMELYLPEELHEHDKYFMRHLLQEKLPSIDNIKCDKMTELRQIFHRLFDRNHPIRTNIYFLGNLEIVKTIRGKS